MATATRDQLKAMLFEHFRQEPRTQFGAIVDFGSVFFGHRLDDSDEEALYELVQEFITSNVLTTMYNKSNMGWPWLSVTTHGREVLEHGGAAVYDHDGYLADVRARIPNLDAVVQSYLSESLRAYQMNLYRASMVMLACSSERAIRLLMDAYIAAIDDPTNRDKLSQRLTGRDISVAYEKFKESFNATKRQVTLQPAINDFDAHVDATFTFIRLLRNTIVHPDAVPTITHALVYSNLQQYSYYVGTIFRLIEWYSRHTITV